MSIKDNPISALAQAIQTLESELENVARRVEVIAQENERRQARLVAVLGTSYEGTL